MVELGWGARIFLGFASVLLLPVITFPLVIRILDEERNSKTFLGLLGYTITDLIIVWAFMGFTQPGIFLALILILITAACGGYNYFAFTMMNRYGR